MAVQAKLLYFAASRQIEKINIGSCNIKSEDPSPDMLAEEQRVEASYKVLVLGDRGVGKTSLLHSLTGKPFQDAMLPTVGLDFVRKNFDVDGAVVQLLIWDSMGLDQMRSINKKQYKGLQGLILVYDVTNAASLDTLKYWTNSLQHDLRKSKGNYEPTPVIVCGNKCDLSTNKKVSSVKGQKFSDEEMAFGFYEISAKTGENVHTAFQRLAYHITDICHPKLFTTSNAFTSSSPGKVNLVNKCLKKLDVSAERCKYRNSAVNWHNEKQSFQTNEKEDIQFHNVCHNVFVDSAS